jgi:hypothetical protein
MLPSPLLASLLQAELLLDIRQAHDADDLALELLDDFMYGRARQSRP